MMSQNATYPKTAELPSAKKPKGKIQLPTRLEVAQALLSNPVSRGAIRVGIGAVLYVVVPVAAKVIKIIEKGKS